MAAGGFLKTNVSTVYDPTRGKLSNDPMLPTQGALLLIDPTHPVLGAWPAGVPADGATVPNLVWQQAVAAIGSGSASSLAGIFNTSGMSGAKGKNERTGKGGLHALFSQVENQTAGDTTHTAVTIPDAIRAFLDVGGAGAAHSIYFSLWGYATRTRVHVATATEMIAGLALSSSQYRALLNGSGVNAPISTNAAHLGTADAPAATLAVGAFRKAIGSKDSSNSGGSGVGSGADRRRAFLVGNSGLLNTFNGGTTPTPLGKTGSRILYRAYLEDLTISGRTFAQVAALDAALYEAEVLTPGGRYYGDTFTNPTALP